MMKEATKKTNILKKQMETKAKEMKKMKKRGIRR